MEAVRVIIQELYNQGNMVIIGRGSQYILRGYKNAWHILLVAELGDRVRFLMKRYQLTEKEAQKAIEQRDEIRRRFLAFFSDKESHDDPLSYDLVIINSLQVFSGKNSGVSMSKIFTVCKRRSRTIQVREKGEYSIFMPSLT